MIVLSEGDISEVLPMATAVGLIETAMVEVSSGRARLPLRSIMEVTGPNKMGIMPGALESPACHGIKILSLFPTNPEAGYSSHQGAIVLFESTHGSPIAMMNAGLLTAIRTAAASAVATKLLARPESRVLTIIGAGEQAEHHLEAMLAVRSIEEIRIVARRADKAEVFAARARENHPELTISSGTDAETAVGAADIVCTVTSSSKPVLSGVWIEPGTHLNVVGASVPSKREIDEDMVAVSSLFVDYRPSTFAQAGDVVGAIESGRITREHVLAEIGEVVSGTHPGRTSPNEITLYRSLGVAAQDLICASHCVVEAKRRGLGVEAPLD